MRKSSKARLFSTCLTGAILAAASPAWAQTGEAPTWKPRAEVDAQVGENIGISTSLFAPVVQNESGLVYIDGRIGYDQRFDRNGSATVGARFRTSEDTAIGVNVGADFYRSDIGSRDQAAVSLGLEGFSSVFDVRVNYRLPLSKTQTIGYIDPDAATTGALLLENNRLIERRSGFRLEAIPLHGFNGEAGVRLPVGGNASLRASVGGFDYRDQDADENYRGVRGGLELDVEDRDSGARFTFGGTLEHDNRYGTDARATVRLSIPLGARAEDRGSSPTGLDRQMGDRVRRDYVARSGSRYTDLTSTSFAIDARTGQAFGGFYYANGAGAAGAGTLASPTTIADAVTRAGAYGVVVALGNAGNIATAGVTLATNQYLLGGAGAVDVRLTNGSTTQFALGGTNGVIVGTSAAGAAVTLGQGSVVRDVTIRGAGTGVAASGVGGFALDRVIIENTGGAGLSLTNTLGSVSLSGLTIRGGAGAGVLINGGSSIALANSTISGGAGAIDINDAGANLTTSLSNLTLSATGGNVLDIDGSGVGTVTVTSLSGITIRGGNGETGGLSVRSATFDANTTTAGIQAVNAGRMEVGTTAARVNGQGVFLTDVTGNLSFTDLDIANSGATGLRVVNAKANSFTLATLDGTIDTVGGTAADLDPLVIDLNFASISSVGASGSGVILHTVQGGGANGNALTIGTLTVTNSGGDGLVLLNSTGLVRVNGGTIGNSGGNSVQIGEQGVAGSGGSVNLIFGGSIVDPSGIAAIVAIFNAAGTINFTGPISGSGGIVVQDTLAGSAISFGAITLTGTAGDAITLNGLAGSINFAGLLTIANPGANGIVIGHVPGGVTFGNVDITGLGNFNGLDVRGAQGNILFNTLDITGTGTGTGINLTGATNAGNVMILAGSVVQGVNIGVNLSQANMTGQFRFGDGDAATLGSRITANVPIVIALMNGTNGGYNFADVVLQGDTSNLTGAGISAYYARVGASGAGTREDPGSLAAAEASGRSYIVLLNDPAGGQDVFDAASAGGAFDLAAGQSLVSFLAGDFIVASGTGMPANLIVSGLGPSGITNPYAGSGGAVLTTSSAGSATVNLANNSTIDGLVIRNAGGDVAVEGSGVSNVRIQNSNITGATGAIAISDGGVTSSVQLTHLDLGSATGTTLALSGAGAGTLTVSGADIDIAATGTSAALALTDLSSGGLGFGTISTDTSATTAVSVQNVTGGNLVFGSIAVGGTAAGAGVTIGGTSGAIVQSISVSGSADDAVQLSSNSGPISIGTITASGSGGDGVALTGNGAVTIGGLTVSGAAGTGLDIQNSLGTVTIGGGAISGVATGISIDGVAAGTGVTIGTLAINGTSGSGIAIAEVDGSVTFTGTTNIAGVGSAGIVLGAGSSGTIAFGDVDITGLGTGRTGVDARAASGTISFNTLDISGSSTNGTRGIDLTGATFATSFATAESGSITGVGIGVDLTNAAITGSFRYGDGSNTDADGAASTISAVTPIVITGLNGGVGTYDFADVDLNGDTTGLVTSATTYFVAEGASGAGTLTDPGSLAGAEASGAQIIVLLNDPAGGQDVLDAVTAGGSFDLTAGQSLLGFLNGDTLTLPGGGPGNLILFGITPGQIVNPFTGSGAPVLTHSGAGNPLNLASNTLVDGIVITAPNGPGIVALEAANVTIRNSVISAAQSAIILSDGSVSASAALRNLQLSAGSGAVVNLDGNGLGTLTITALDEVRIAGGNGEIFGILGNGVVFDADLATAGIQTVSGAVQAGTAGARIGGTGVYLADSEGAANLALDIAADGATGLFATGGIGGFRFDTSAGTIDVTNASGFGLYLRDLSSSMTLASLGYSGSGTAVELQNIAGVGAGGRALDIASLTVADGAAAAITMIGAASGRFDFGAGSSIGTTVGAAVALANTGASSFNYAGSIVYAGADAVLSVSGGHSGTVNFTGAIDASSGLGLVFQNADGVYDFSGTTSLAAGIAIGNGSAGSFSFGADTTIISPAGPAIDIQNSTASLNWAGQISYAGGAAAAINILNHSGGTLGFSGLIDVTTGTGASFDNADGIYTFDGVLTIDAGAAGVRVVNGSGGDFTFGAGTAILNNGGSALAVTNSTASIDYLGYAFAFGGTGIDVTGHSGGTIDFSAATLDLGGGTTVRFDDADGTYVFGTFATTGGAQLAIRNGSAGTFSFGDVDMADIGANQTAVDLTGATGNVTFQTLDITGSSTVGSKGVDLTGSTTAANIIVNESSTITGVGVGVDLTNAAITGTFRYGDGSSADADGAASLIDAVTPIVITGMNAGVGTYNFADVVLTGDTSGLVTTRTVFWVQAGASGSGTRTDPGSLAAAEASGTDVIILLDTQGAGQDIIDAALAGGGLDLAANQSLLSFLDGDTLSVGGGAPANLVLFGITGGTVTNPNAGSGAPLLTTTQAGATTVNVASGVLIDGVQIGNLDWKGVYGAAVTDVTIRNSVVQGGVNAVQIIDNGGTASVALNNLALSSGTGDVLSLIGNGGGQLTVSQLANIVIAGGNGGGGLASTGVVFDASVGAGIQAVVGTVTIGSSTSRVGGAGLVLSGATGGLSLATTIFNTNGDGVLASGGAGGFTLTLSSGAIDTGLVAASGSALNLADLSADIQLTGVAYSGPGYGVRAHNVAGIGAAGRALDIGTLTVSAGAAGGILLSGTTSGNVSFGSGSSIVGTTGAGITLANSGAGAFNYSGNITGITAGALVSVSSGDIGNAVFSGTLSATGGTGLQFDNADGFYTFSGATTLNGGDAGIDIVNGSSGNFLFEPGTSITSPSGAGIDIQASTAGLHYRGTLSFATAGQAAVNVVDHSGGTILLSGTLNATNGTGLQFSNADGFYQFGGAVTLNGGDAGIDIVNGSGGDFIFAGATSITSPTGIAINVADSTAKVDYLGSLTYATAGTAAISVLNHSTGTISIGSGGSSVTATNGTGLQFNNADGTYAFTSTTSLNGGDAQIAIVNGSDGSFTFGAGVSITDPSGAAFVVDTSDADITYSGSLTYGVGAGPAIDIFRHAGTITFQTGAIDVTSGGGIVFEEATGSYLFTGPIDINGADTGIRINPSSGSFTFADVDIDNADTAFAITGSSVTLTYVGSITGTGAGATGFDIAGDASNLDFTGAVVTLSNGVGVDADDADGVYSFGAMTLAGEAVAIVNGSDGDFTFGNVDITAVGANQTAVDLTGANGNVTFATLDITGASATGTRGIDLTGNTGTGDIVVTNSSTISGVGIGVDLTNGSRPGLFQYGDGESVLDIASTISATTPLVITGLNGGTGTYNFADVNLVGDTSGLSTSASVYYVLAGASGAGTLGDPGSLAGAEAATADFIVLLNDPTGGQDVLDALGSNGNDSFLLDANQALRSFRDGNTITLPGGAPANVIVNVTTGQVVNPYGVPGDTATDRAPTLTTTGAAAALVLANNASVDGVFVQGVSGQAAVQGSGVSGVTLSNATFSGAGIALRLTDGAAVASATLTNLTLSASGANAAVALSGAGAGSLTVSGSGNNVSHSGSGALMTIADVLIGGGNLGFGSVASTGTGGVDLGTIGGFGTLSFGSITVAGSAGAGVSLQNSTAAVNLGNVTVANAATTGLALASNSGAITVGTIAISGSPTGMSVSGLTSTLTVGDGTIDGASTAGILVGAGNTVSLSFGNIDITGLQTGARGVDARSTGGGNVYFETLDITGASATGTRGIDLTGNTGSGNFTVNESSTITGVGIGVDLTNASRTGGFRYGDGSNIDFDVAASTINAATPLVIGGLNPNSGSYDFRDVNLVGDTSALEASAFFVRAGATGIGTASDPGSLAAADASTATYIVLLDTQMGAGSSDTITGTLTLADNQTLLAFRDTDTFNVAGGAPPNVLLHGVTSGTITNPYGTSGAPLLTSADAVGTVQLGGTSVIDGAVISNSGAGAAVYANGTAGTATIRNSTISGGGAAVDIRSGAVVRTVNLQNLTLANAGSQPGALLNLNGTGGTLTLTGMSNLSIDTAGGETAGLVFNTVTFDSDLATAGIQAVNAGALTIGTTSARVQGDGLSLTNVSGALTFSDLNIANNGGTGLLVANSKANSFLLTTLDGSTDTTGGTAVNLDPLTVNITLASVSATNGAYGILLDQVDGSFTVTGGVTLTGATTAGIAIQDNTAQTDALDATFNGSVSINNTSGSGLSFTNNAGATISFAGGGTGVDVVTTSGAGLVASGGGTLNIAGSGNSILTATGQIANFNGVTAGTSGINFASLRDTGVVANTALVINNLDGGAFSGGSVQIGGTSGATSDGIWIGGGSSSAVSFGNVMMGGLGDDGIEINGAGNGAITIASVVIDGTAGDGVLLTGSDGTVTISGGEIGSANDAAANGVTVNGGSGTVTINAEVWKTTAGRVIEVTNRTGGSVAFQDDVFSLTASHGISLVNNSGGTISFSGATQTLTGLAGLDLAGNTGATINFTGGGLTINPGAVDGLEASGGGTLNITGSGNTVGSGITRLSGVTVGSGGINFASVAGTIELANVGSSGGAITLGTVNMAVVGGRGITVSGTLGAALSIADLDINLNQVGATAIYANGATLAAGITVGDFDVTNSVAAGSTIAVDLRGTTGGQVIRLGDSAVGGASSSITGVNTGVALDAATNVLFTFGDGESAIDGGSTISAITPINAAAAPVAGNYDFRDVTFAASPGTGFGIGRTLFVDSNGATGGGNGSGADGANPMTLGAAELALGATDVIVLINNGNAISTAASNADNTLNLLADSQVRGFGQGALSLALTVPATIQLSSNTINIADPTGNGAATLTSSAGANVITLGASGNRISGFILDGDPAGALRGIVDNGGATGTVINFMTIRNFDAVGGYGVEITPSTNTTIDNVTFTGNANDVFLNAAGSTLTNVTATGATGTSITLDNATGTTTLTNVSIGSTATGLSFTNAAGTINASNVDISGAATSALTVSGGTASFNFDAASSIIQASAGLAVNFAGNHTTGTFAYAGLINATNGAGLQFSDADGTYNFTGTTTLNGGNAGVDILAGSTGTFAFGSGTTLTHNAAGNAFVLLNSSANVTFDGTITDNDGVAVQIDQHDAGTATFNGAITSSNANASTVISIGNSNGGAINFNGQMAIASTASAVVNLSNNDGGTVTFNAGGTGLDITANAGTALAISGGGTVNVLGSDNSIVTNSGTLLSVANTGATSINLNLNFASATNTSGADGIVVQRTAGTLGGTVNIAGGAITASARGVSLTGDALNFTYGGTVTTSGATARSFQATSRTAGAVILSGNLTDTSLGISAASNSGGSITFSGQTISLNTGANAAVTLSNNSGATINFAPAAGGNGLDIVTTTGAGFTASGGGTVSVAGSGNSIQTAAGQVLNLSAVSAGSGGINWASLQSTGVVGAIAININNLDAAGGAFSGGITSIAGTSGGNDAIFIGNGSAANVSFGATTLGTGANVVSGDGIEINGSGNGTVTFTSVDIDNTTAHGISIIGAAGATGAITISGGTIGAGGAGSITGDGVNITGGSGTITVAASIAKTNAGNVVEVSSHAGGTVTFSNNISATAGAANGILLNNNSGGTIVFSGATKTLTTGTNNAIQFDNNNATGAAVSFTGGNLDIDTGSGRGITATSTTAGAGSLTITGTNNTIVSAGGIALNLVNTNIAAGGLNFLSIAANGGTRGIVLNTTGGAAGLTITGTGTTDGSGGTIQNITQRGIELLNTALVNISNVNLTNASTTGQANGQNLTTANGAIYLSGVATAVFNNINITGTIADNGITGVDVSNFQLNNSLITGAGDSNDESGIEFINLSGTSSLTNTEIALSRTNSLDIVNTDVNLNLTLNNVIFRDTQSSGIGEGGLQFLSFSNAAGTPTTNIDIVDSDFLRIRTQGIQVIGEDDSVVSIDITNSVIDSQTGIGAGIDINGNDTSTVRFNIIGNPTIRSSGGAAINITSFISANVMGRIINNADIEVYSQTPAGTGASGSGVRALAQENSHLTVAVTGNTITQGPGNNSSAVDIIAREGSARLDLTLTGNVIDSTDVNTLADINIQSGSSSGTAIETNQIYANIANNNLTATAAPVVLRLRVSELDNTHDPRIFLQGFVEGGAGLDDDAVATWNANGNTPGASTTNVTVSLTGTATGPSAGTTQTPTNPLP